MEGARYDEAGHGDGGQIDEKDPLPAGAGRAAAGGGFSGELILARPPPTTTPHSPTLAARAPPSPHGEGAWGIPSGRPHTRRPWPTTPCSPPGRHRAGQAGQEHSSPWAGWGGDRRSSWRRSTCRAWWPRACASCASGRSAARRRLYIIEKLSTYGLRTVGLLVALSVMGINLTSLAVFAGALGVGVGLGLQGLVKDFASGISLMFERLVAVGDFVELQNGARGVVHEIGPRSTRHPHQRQHRRDRAQLGAGQRAGDQLDPAPHHPSHPRAVRHRLRGRQGEGARGAC